MGKKLIKRHWFLESLRLKVGTLPKKKQVKSEPGQISLPGMEGEAERNVKRKQLGEHHRRIARGL